MRPWTARRETSATKEIRNGNRDASAWSALEHYAWTVFVALGLILFLFGVSDLFGDSSMSVKGVLREIHDLNRENSFDEMQSGLFLVLVAVFGLRRGDRWAWYAMWLLPIRVVAEIWRAWSFGDPGEALTATFVLVLTLGAVALAYRRSFHTAKSS